MHIQRKKLEHTFVVGASSKPRPALSSKTKILGFGLGKEQIRAEGALPLSINITRVKLMGLLNL